MGAIRKFELSTPRKKKEIGRAPTVELCDPVTNAPLYTVERRGDSEIAYVYKVPKEATEDWLKDDIANTPVVGAVRAAEALGGSCQYCFGDPADERTTWISVEKNRRFSKVQDFLLFMPDPVGKAHKFHWKHTKDVGGLFSKLDTLNMKLIDESNGEVVARFVHKTSIWVMEGTFEMHEDLGEEWDLQVFLSCLAVLKYNGLFFNLNVI
jgi:hypothetical protein